MPPAPQKRILEHSIKVQETFMQSRIILINLEE